MAWSLGSTAGLVARTTVGSMLVTITLSTSVGRALEHAGVIAFGGVAQAVLILLLPTRRWWAHRDAPAEGLAGVADYARRLRHDPTAPFDPEPLMTTRDAVAVTPSQARTRPSSSTARGGSPSASCRSSLRSPNGRRRPGGGPWAGPRTGVARRGRRRPGRGRPFDPPRCRPRAEVLRVARRARCWRGPPGRPPNGWWPRSAI